MRLKEWYFYKNHTYGKKYIFKKRWGIHGMSLFYLLLFTISFIEFLEDNEKMIILYIKKLTKFLIIFS